MIKILACGISKYEGADNLSFCVNDAKEFCKAFDENIIVDQINNFSGNGEIRKKEYNKIFKKFCKEANNKDILIYFHSGHGGIDKYGKSVLQLTDDVIYIDKIVKMLNASKAKSKIIILDACHCDMGSEYMPPINKNNIDDFCGKGIVIFSSCRKNEESAGSEKDGISVFTNFLCKAVRDDWLVKDKFLYFNDLQNLVSIYAENYNKKHPKEQQTPVVRTSLIGTAAFPTRKCKEKIKIDEQRIETKEFDLLNIKGSIKKGNCGEKRKFVRATVVLKAEMEKKSIESIIENVEICLQENREKIVSKKWKEQKKFIEIMHLLIYKNDLDRELDIYSYIGKWTLSENDNNWHEKNKMKCRHKGYMSWEYNKSYDYFKKIKTKNVFSDKDLISFWEARIKIISEETAEFDKKYREYISKDISCNDLKKCAITVIFKLEKIIRECDDSDFPMPFSKCKRLQKLGLQVVTDARSIPQIFLLCEEKKEEFIGRIDLEWEQYYKSFNEWEEEKKLLSKYLERKRIYFIRNIIRKVKDILKNLHDLRPRRH